MDVTKALWKTREAGKILRKTGKYVLSMTYLPGVGRQEIKEYWPCGGGPQNWYDNRGIAGSGRLFGGEGGECPSRVNLRAWRNFDSYLAIPRCLSLVSKYSVAQEVLAATSCFFRGLSIVKRVSLRHNPLRGRQMQWWSFSSRAAAFLLLLSMAACGNSHSSSGSSSADALLSGTYVFGISGCITPNPDTALGGQFTADGQGNITAGSLTSNTILSPSFLISGAPLTGSYSMTSDGRGQASLTTSSETIALNFVLVSKAHGYVMEFDNNGCGSGTLDLQTTVSQTNLAGSYVVSLVGEYSKNANPLVIAGAFTLDASGNITSGILDGVGSPPFTLETWVAQPLSGSLLVGSGNSPGKAEFQTFLGTSPTPFDVYPIDATHLKLIGTNEVFIGDAFSQGTALPSGSQVFTLTGDDTTSSMTVGGLMTFDGNGNVIAGLEDLNETGPYLSMPFSGSYSALDSNGRATMTLTGFSPHLQSIGSNAPTQFVLYPSTSGLLILEIDGIAGLMGPAFVQTNPSLQTGQPFGMFLSGVNGSGYFSNTAQFTTGSSGTSFSGMTDSNTFEIIGTIWTQTSGQSLTSTYSFDSATGRGSLSSNSSPDLEFYLIDATSAVFIGISSGQQAEGSFAVQTLSGTKSSMLTPPRFSFAKNAGRPERGIPHRD
jgi:hypothetical protein